jgi:hypothetical protein
MAKGSSRDYFDAFDTPYQTQPPKGAAEGPLDYGKVTAIPNANDPMGVLPIAAKQHNIGPEGGEGH